MQHNADKAPFPLKLVASENRAPAQGIANADAVIRDSENRDKVIHHETELNDGEREAGVFQFVDAFENSVFGDQAIRSITLLQRFCKNVRLSS
jgi:hypothetical protein